MSKQQPTIGETLHLLTKRAIDLLHEEKLLTRKESEALFTHYKITPDKIVYGLKTFALPPYEAGQLREYLVSEAKKLTGASRTMHNFWQAKSTPQAIETVRKRLATGIAERPDFLENFCEILELGLKVIGAKAPI